MNDTKQICRFGMAHTNTDASSHLVPLEKIECSDPEHERMHLALTEPNGRLSSIVKSFLAEMRVQGLSVTTREVVTFMETPTMTEMMSHASDTGAQRNANKMADITTKVLDEFAIDMLREYREGSLDVELMLRNLRESILMRLVRETLGQMLPDELKGALGL